MTLQELEQEIAEINALIAERDRALASLSTAIEAFKAEVYGYSVTDTNKSPL